MNKIYSLIFLLCSFGIAGADAKASSSTGSLPGKITGPGETGSKHVVRQPTIQNFFQLMENCATAHSSKTVRPALLESVVSAGWYILSNACSEGNFKRDYSPAGRVTYEKMTSYWVKGPLSSTSLTSNASAIPRFLSFFGGCSMTLKNDRNTDGRICISPPPKTVVYES